MKKVTVYFRDSAREKESHKGDVASTDKGLLQIKTRYGWIVYPLDTVLRFDVEAWLPSYDTLDN